MYLHVILYYVSCCQKLAFTVSTLLSWKLHWDPSDLGRVARDLFTKRFTIRLMWNLQKILRYFFLLLLVCQMWTEQDSAEMIQDSPSQCQHILYFIKDKTLLLIGSNDQTHLIDPNSLSDMNYHDCFDSFVCFFVTGYHHLQSPEKHCQQHRHRHQEVDFKHLFPSPLFPVAKVDEFFAFRWFSNLGKDVALAQKKTIHPLT